VVSADAARTYYAAGDYYRHGQAKDFIGNWHGLGAGRLGITGPVDPKVFDALLRNRDPVTGKSLTGSSRANRRAGVDFTVNVPKSLSVLYFVTGDERIVDMTREAARETMASVEARMMARVRTGGQSHDRQTGNMIWGEFVQFTTRPASEREESPSPEGDSSSSSPAPPDPHLHIHAVAPNLTWDDDEGKWKALQLEEYGKRKDWSERPRFQAEFYARLAEKIRRLGYGVRRTASAFEVEGVPERVIAEFSRRKEEIRAKADELGITTAAGRAIVARTSRRRKDRTLGWDELRETWLARISPEELASIRAAYENSLAAPAPEFQDGAAVDWALSHLLSRESVVPERDLAVSSLMHGIGTGTADGILEDVRKRELVRAEVEGMPMVSTRGVLAEELAVLGFAKGRRGKLKPLNQGGVQHDERLSAEQREAVSHVWNSRDPITIIRGKAGTGKTTMMREAIAGIIRSAVSGIRSDGHAVAVLAPTATAAYDVLRDKEGFAEATTVANFLDKPELQQSAQGGVIWCDEAGLMGFADMAALVRTADRLGARIVLSGDRKQLRSVARGEPLAVLEDLAGLPVVELKEIRRQQGDYKAAVEKLASGQVAEGFDQLSAMGAIKPMPAADKYGPLVEEYIQGLQNGKDMLILSPTHQEGEVLTTVLRHRLKQEGMLGADERELERLVPLHLTDAQRADPVAIAGTVVAFGRAAAGFQAGERVEVTSANAGAIAKAPMAFTVYRREQLTLAPGDLLRIAGNGRDRSGKKRVNNGSVFRVKGFDPKTGDVILSNGLVLGKGFGKWALGYANTSFAGQGKTVDKVLLALSANSYPAANARQAYVDASRGREGISIYCEDPKALRQAMSRDRKRLHALDLVVADTRTRHRRILDHIAHMRRVSDLGPATEYRNERRLAQMGR
jgi:hypothetical protein